MKRKLVTKKKEGFMMKRKLTLALVCGFTALNFAQAKALENVDNTAIYVTDNDYISTYMDYISTASSSIYISKGEATVSCSAYGYQGITTRVKIDASLQQYKNGKWTSIATFTNESNSYRVSISETSSITKGYKYRVKATVKAYNGSSVETRTVTSSEAKY